MVHHMLGDRAIRCARRLRPRNISWACDSEAASLVQGFRKLPAPNQEFCHLCFKRGQPQLLSQICRGGMPSSSATADGPAAEISNLKSQVSSDMSYPSVPAIRILNTTRSKHCTRQASRHIPLQHAVIVQCTVRSRAVTGTHPGK